MTNVLAVNAVVPKKIDTQYFLRATKQGFPINNQIPRTYQVYTGTGNQTINYDGSNEIRIFGQTLVGPLIINFGPQRRLRDMVGRLVTLNIIGPVTQSITLNSSPAFMKINGTSLQQLSHVIPGDNISKSITIYFHSEQFINLDYGAAASTSLLQNNSARTSNLSSTYVYGTDTIFNLPAVYIPDAQSYGMFLNPLEPTTDGTVSAFVGSLTGPGAQIVPFEYRPSPRHNKSTIVTGYIDDGGNASGAFDLTLSPILSNVFDNEFFIASNDSGIVSMYDPLVSYGGVPTTLDANGFNVDTPVDTGPIAVDLADSLLFYVETTSDTIIKWKSYTTYKDGTLLRVSDLSNGVWNTGDRIVDIAFDDKNSSLVVLPNNSTTGKILNIPIKPYKNSDPNTVYTGVLLGGIFNLGVGTVLHSLAVCPITREIYVACKPSLFTNSIYKLKPFPDLNSTFSHQDPTINTGRTAVCFTSQGTLLILFESTLDLYRVNNGWDLSTQPGSRSVLYTLSQYHRSLSPNCYGWTQA